MQKSIGKWEIRKIVTPKNLNLKFCTRDYVREATHLQILVVIGTARNSAHIGEILPLCDFCDCSCWFFSNLRPGRTAEPIFML